MSYIQNKTALVTGGANGIGYKISEKLLRNGLKSVAILDVNPVVGEEAAATLEKEFGKDRAIFLVCDVTKSEEFEECFKKVKHTFGYIDIVVNNAGMLNDKAWEQTINLNTTAVIRGTFLAMDYLGKHNGGKGGTVLNMSSIVGLACFHSAPVYTASKHAVVGFTGCMKGHYDMSGIRFLTMCPGVTATSLVKDITTKMLSFVPPETTKKEMKCFEVQTVDHLANAIIQLIEKGENGAIWVCEGGKPPYAVHIPDYKTLAVPA